MIVLEPGMPVVCVDADDTNCWNIVELVKGNHYVIAWVGRLEKPKLFDVDPNVIVCHLEEISSRPAYDTLLGQFTTLPIKAMEELWGRGCGGFTIRRFRPLHQDKVDAIIKASVPKIIGRAREMEKTS